jgi:trk system potassium uptake protein TrkH
MLYGALILTATLIIRVTDDFTFRQTVFEVVSALGTVGLTTGITPDLSTAGQGVIIALMFIGRVGPLVIMYLLARRTREPAYRLPEGTLGIG